MLISEFAREAELSTDTVRFYVRKGLLTPETGGKGGSNPYQIFTSEHVEVARMIRMGQSLGFSLKEIASFAEEYRLGELTPGRSREIMQSQLDMLEEKASQLAGMIAYIRAKVDWLDRGSHGDEPRFTSFTSAKGARRAIPGRVGGPANRSRTR